MEIQLCRICGCTDFDCRQCIEKTGEPCCWIENDLCSACIDEKGFVFIDSADRPFWCRKYGDEPWIMYWHVHQKSWVTLRKVNQTEIWKFHEMKVPEEQANFFHTLHEKHQQ
jgi:hypothetical protein